MSISKQLRGLGVALATPFMKNGDIDFDGLKRLIDFVIDNGVNYVVSLGTTGESVTLDEAEKHRVLDFTIETVNKRVPVVAGFGGNDTRKVLHQMEAYHFNGVDAILSVCPYYNRPSQEGLFRHFEIIAKEAPRPVLLYNVPSRTSCNMEAKTAIRLAQECPNITGIKEASGNLTQCSQIIRYKGRPDFLVLSGDDFITLPGIACGMDGVISVVGNAFPAEFGVLVRSALADDFKTARNMHYRLLTVMELLFADGNPGGIKYALHLLGICGYTLRLPLVPPNAQVREALKTEMTLLMQALEPGRTG
ncbi:4-hydroxy-tetrahydrodipicolinate synthase [Sphingobacteriales bacterium UPWRP_1]|nr:4-hydroxy-tetrahydrodipicolinate synthase [Sphingobacteriales bacterium TSM_CSS]PSJ77629.1 4-hydroxy-tetrahydrodipicolinate synthase [Sphingobacteriales bacterium UPWRP_1]